MKNNIALLVVSIIATLICAEIAIKFLNLAPQVGRIELNKPYGIFIQSDNPILKYVQKPKTGDINSYGIRDYQYPISKPKDVFRILVVGDSIGFGFCTDEERLELKDTFPKLLEEELNKRHFKNSKKIEVINLSVCGYDTTQEIEFFAIKGVPLHPDLVIIAYCLNDNYDASAELPAFKTHTEKISEKLKALYKNCFLKSGVFRMICNTFFLSAKNNKSDRLHTGFLRLKNLADTHKFKTLVVIFPYFEDYKTYSRYDRHRQTETVAKDNGFYTLDLLPDFKNASGNNSRALQGRCNREHPDEMGHKVAGEAIRRYLIYNKLIE